MSASEINGNGKSWLTKSLVQIIMILALSGYIVIEKVFKPGAGNDSQNIIIDINSQRIARLEECIITLRPLPTEVAGLKATLDGVKTKVDSIERKLDTHIDK
jgi:hypothetical protein